MSNYSLSVFSILLFLYSFSVFSQHGNWCASVEMLNHQISQKPGLEKSYAQAETLSQQWLEQRSKSGISGTVTIPVVVHIIYNQPDSAVQNLPDSFVHAQINAMNEDFRKLNNGGRRPVFDSIAADTGIEFCLASVDSSGNVTTGITRTLTTKRRFDLSTGNNEMMSSATGGVDPWPTDRYLNVWVCDIYASGANFLGFAQAPGGSPLTDGIVVDYSAFGGMNSSFKSGKVATHEVGHWLGLVHVWGSGGCDNDDKVDDTPRANAASPDDCNTQSNTCSDTGGYWGGFDPPDMVENYMDYSSKQCQNMFSNGQSERMWSFLRTSRNALFSSKGCGGTTLNAYGTTVTSCKDSCEGAIDVHVFSGSPPYVFSWSGLSSTDSTLKDLCRGTYEVTISDALLDTVVLDLQVREFPEMVRYINVLDASCSTCDDGLASITVGGGLPPYTYLWNDDQAQTDATAFNLKPGEYSVEVVDNCGVRFTETVLVGYPTSILNVINPGPFEFTVSPNPAFSQLKIETNANEGLTTVRLINVLGKVMYSNGINSRRLFIDISKYRAGLYILHVTHGNKSSMKKITISH